MRCGLHVERTPSALLDWNNSYGDDPDKAVNLPKHFFADVNGVPGNHRRYGRQVQHFSAPCMAA
jgi:hypothetical protein